MMADLKGICENFVEFDSALNLKKVKRELYLIPSKAVLWVFSRLLRGDHRSLLGPVLHANALSVLGGELKLFVWICEDL